VPSKHDPANSIADISENADRIAAHIAGMDRDGFARSDLVRDAVERCIGRVCEAAHRLGDHGDPLMPGQIWRDIRCMGNQLRHAYDRINVDIKTASKCRLRLPRRILLANQRDRDGRYFSRRDDTFCRSTREH
jgi:uncharacterized protein with HEPN domain